jgi:cytosine/adenosine deaminase-related metal-dependent hydrolase
VFAAAGALTRRFTAVHATHLGVGDVAALGHAAATCCFCPTTERDLADGIGPSHELVAAGASLAVGSDQHAVIDPFEELRGVEMDERLRSLKRGTHAAPALIEMGTTNGYRCLGWDGGGTLAAGALADLTVVGMDSIRLAGGDESLDTIVFGATSADVTDVMVNGNWQVRDRRHVRLDVVGELRSSISAVTGAHP